MKIKMLFSGFNMELFVIPRPGITVVTQKCESGGRKVRMGIYLTICHQGRVQRITIGNGVHLRGRRGDSKGSGATLVVPLTVNESQTKRSARSTT